MPTTQVTDSSFEHDVINAAGPVLVDFSADWCSSCRALSPTLEEVSKELGERLTVVKLDVDENPAAAARYGVRSIPSLILFKGGEPTATRIGAAPKGALRGWIDGHL